jgi:hypothetical protein
MSIQNLNIFEKLATKIPQTMDATNAKRAIINALLFRLTRLPPIIRGSLPVIVA